jgi:signal transduction histidine kinase
MNIDEKVPTIITSDEKRLKQVLVNLISNAVKYTSSGSITLNVECVKSPKGENDEIKFTVEDTGIGFSEEQIKLFSNNKYTIRKPKNGTNFREKYIKNNEQYVIL